MWRNLFHNAKFASVWNDSCELQYSKIKAPSMKSISIKIYVARLAETANFIKNTSQNEQCDLYGGYDF